MGPAVTPATSRRWAARAGAALCALGLLGIVVSDARAQPAKRAFLANATAEGARHQYSLDGFLVVETLADVGGPVAQSQLDASGGSRSFASLPYPGDTVVTAPGLIASSGGPPLPAYPFEVSAEHPVRPEQELVSPTGDYELRAAAVLTDSTGFARSSSGGQPPSSRATTHAVTEFRQDGTVEARAEAVVQGIQVGDGALRITTVRSTSRTVLAPGDPEPVTTTDLDVEGASVNGVPVTIGPEGLAVDGSPLAGAGPSDELENALADAGVSVRWIEGEPVAGGYAGDTLEITWDHTVPVPGDPTGTSVFSVGGALTFVQLGGELGAPQSPPGPAPTAPRPAAAPDVAEPRPPSAPVATVAPPSRRPSAAPPAVPARPVVLARDLGRATHFFYLVVAVGGAVLVMSSSIWRTKGVQQPWRS